MGRFCRAVRNAPYGGREAVTKFVIRAVFSAVEFLPFESLLADDFSEVALLLSSATGLTCKTGRSVGRRRPALPFASRVRQVASEMQIRPASGFIVFLSDRWSAPHAVVRVTRRRMRS